MQPCCVDPFQQPCSVDRSIEVFILIKTSRHQLEDFNSTGILMWLTSQQYDKNIYVPEYKNETEIFCTEAEG